MPCLRSNNKVTPEEAIDKDEITSEVNALMPAAHESSSALARITHILSGHPDVQSKLRSEVRETHRTYGEELNYDQLKSLWFLDAVCQEPLRLYTPALFLIRVPQEDSTIPLSYLGKSNSGEETMTHVPIKKGSYIYLSLGGANRDECTWGEGSNLFRPSRWLDSTPPSLSESRIPGVYLPLRASFGLLNLHKY
ncbi:cytochrome P450 [Rhizoctonia solani]|nr:cytochrome P450 [Rhizoctonia solani]